MRSPILGHTPSVGHPANTRIRKTLAAKTAEVCCGRLSSKPEEMAEEMKFCSVLRASRAQA